MCDTILYECVGLKGPMETCTHQCMKLCGVENFTLNPKESRNFLKIRDFILKHSLPISIISNAFVPTSNFNGWKKQGKELRGFEYRDKFGDKRFCHCVKIETSDVKPFFLLNMSSETENRPCHILVLDNLHKQIDYIGYDKAPELHPNVYYSCIGEIVKNNQVIYTGPTQWLKMMDLKNYKKIPIGSYSRGQIEWLTFLEKSKKITIQHSENGGEYSIPSTRFHADGYCKATNTIYEYHGDFWHGNPKLYRSNALNKVSKKTFGQLYKQTVERESKLKVMGFTVVFIWESDWKRFVQSVTCIQRRFRVQVFKINMLKVGVEPTADRS